MNDSKLTHMFPLGIQIVNMAAAAAVPPVLHTVQDAMFACGVPLAPAFDGMNPVERISEALFNNEFDAAVDVSFDELDTTLKTYANLAQNQGRIRIDPIVKKRIRAFIQWVRDFIRTFRDPASEAFPVADTVTLIKRHATHKLFVDRASSAKEPEAFSNQTKWTDWYPTFINYLRELPGRNGVPLSYVLRDHVQPDRIPRLDFIDEYVHNAPLHDEAFTIDNKRVATLIRGFIVGNETAETKVQSNPDQHDGRAIVQSLIEMYAGSGLYAKDLVRAEKIVADSFYAGEKKPHMWWDKFESDLMWAYTTIDREANRIVYDDNQKIRKLLKNVRADFLGTTLATIRSGANRQPPTINFLQAMTDCRLTVYKKFPPTENPALTRTRRHVNEVGRGRGTGGRGRHYGRGGGGRGGRGGRGNYIRKTRNDSKIITLKDGSRIEYHPSFRFTNEQLRLFTNEQRDELTRQRTEWRNRNQGNRDDDQRTIKELRSELNSIRESIRRDVPDQVDTSGTNASATQVSQVTTGTRTSTMMRGRNSQVNEVSGRSGRG